MPRFGYGGPHRRAARGIAAGRQPNSAAATPALAPYPIPAGPQPGFPGSSHTAIPRSHRLPRISRPSATQTLVTIRNREW